MTSQSLKIGQIRKKGEKAPQGEQLKGLQADIF
jgi:hypothetical protein